MGSSFDAHRSGDPIAAPVFTAGTGLRAPHDFGGSLEVGDIERGPAETPWLLVAIVGVVLGALWSRWRPRAAAPTVVARRRRALRPAAG
ncbi:MAG: hypothetical protein U1E39_03860 [Planctomycetota bacterium]